MKLISWPLSIKNKILIVLSTLPVIAISAVVVIAINVFKDDKIAYIYDSTLSSVRGKSSSVESQINGFIQSLKALSANYDPQLKTLSPNGKSYFDTEDALKSFSHFSWDGEEFNEKFIVSKHDRFNEEESQLIEVLLQEAYHKGFNLGVSQQFPLHLYIMARSPELDEGQAIMVLVVETESFFTLFSENETEKNYLFHNSRGLILGGEGLPQLQEYLEEQVFDHNFAEGTKETNFGNKTYLSSYSKVGLADLFVVSLVDKQLALIAVGTLVRRAIVATGIILCVLIVVGVIASSGITLALRQLADATRRVMDGDFSFKVDKSGSDEIGTLAESFNKMTDEVSRLMEQTAENARMEAELKTAHTVQDTLFPQSEAHIGPISIYGKSVPATECGGDWWHYSEKNNKVFIWIGDATGHGVPAALLTSAARAVASVIENIDDVSPAQALSILNKAIHSTSKGQMMMTFFLACIDFDKNKMTYCNASHDPPFFLSHEVDGKPKRKDYIPLMDVNSPRLGERHDSEYKDFEMDISRGDKIVFYTDGIVDVKSPEGDLYGERRFIKALSRNADSKVNDTVDWVFENFNEFRQQTPLDDDVTLVIVQYQRERVA
jgi:phosphoserine phosphatase RsbU/P